MTPAEIDHLMQHYFRAPNPTAAVEAFIQLAEHGEFAKPRRKGALAFFSKVTAITPSIEDAMRAAAKRYRVRLASTFVVSMRDKSPALTPAGLDVVWAHYFATGDLRFAQKIAGAAQAFAGTPTGAAAHWSLDAISQTHPEVAVLRGS